MDMHFLPFFIQEHIYLVDEPARETPEPDKNTVAEEPGEKEYTGSPAPPIDHSVAVVINGGRNGRLAPVDQQFLEKILKAVQLNMQEVGIYHFEDSKPLALPFRELQKVIGFGVNPENVTGDNATGYYGIITAETGTKCLFADELHAIASDVQKKKKLWAKLQQLF